MGKLVVASLHSFQLLTQRSTLKASCHLLPRWPQMESSKMPNQDRLPQCLLGPNEFDLPRSRQNSQFLPGSPILLYPALSSYSLLLLQRDHQQVHYSAGKWGANGMWYFSYFLIRKSRRAPIASLKILSPMISFMLYISIISWNSYALTEVADPLGPSFWGFSLRCGVLGFYPLLTVSGQAQVPTTLSYV